MNFLKFAPKRKFVLLVLFLLILLSAFFAVVSIASGAGLGNIGAWFPFLYFSLLFLATYSLEPLHKLLKKAYRPIIAVFYAGMSAIAVAFAIFCVLILAYAPSDMPDSPDLLIVLGCQVYGDRPGDTLKTRLDAAIEILNDHPELVCIVSGGQGPDETVPEAHTMEKYLVDSGIDAKRIYKESESSSSFLNLTLSKDLIAEQGLTCENIAIVTSEYHIPRAMMIAGRIYADSNIYAIKARTPLKLFGAGLMREFFAFAKSYVLDRQN
ncbi:MAG: YdcF family protein [Oscillospiraceae bacterium]|nr:YdcF family protein [Oscillospiraceae bacterium]